MTKLTCSGLLLEKVIGRKSRFYVK